MRDCDVHVLARVPAAGGVKTRLQPVLGAAGCAKLARRLLRRTLATALHAGVGPVTLWVAGWPGHPALPREARVRLRRQPPGDLGARMGHVAGASLRRNRVPILVGTDCPGLAPGDLGSAAAALGAGTDAVLGPAHDGGYYLLGLARPAPALFRGMPWGGPGVFRESARRLRAANRRVRVLPVRRDLDVPEDLGGLSPFGVAFGDLLQRLGERGQDC